MKIENHFLTFPSSLVQYRPQQIGT